MAEVAVSQPVPLNCQCQGPGVYPVATVYNGAGAVLATVPLQYLAAGLYAASSYIMPNLNYIYAIYAVYSDPGFTTLSPLYSYSSEPFTLSSDSGGGGGGSVIGQVVTGVIVGNQMITGVIENE